MKTVVLLIMTIALSASCGRSGQQGGDTVDPNFTGGQSNVGLNGNSSASASDAKCETKEKCPAADIAVKIDGGFNAEKKELIGLVDRKVEWSFEIIDRSGSGRKGLVIVNGFGSEFDVDVKDERVVVKHAAFKKKDSGKNIVVLARDIERCQMTLGRDACRGTKELTDYDKKHELTWQIMEEDEVNKLVSNVAAQNSGAGSVVRVSDPTCGGFQPTSNGQIMMNGLSNGLNVLTGILSGSPQGILGAVVPIVGGMVAGGNQEPVQC